MAASQCYPTAMLAKRFVLNLLHTHRFTHSVPCVIDDASGANFDMQVKVSVRARVRVKVRVRVRVQVRVRVRVRKPKLSHHPKRHHKAP